MDMEHLLDRECAGTRPQARTGHAGDRSAADPRDAAGARVDRMEARGVTRSGRSPRRERYTHAMKRSAAAPRCVLAIGGELA
jgi:hypothetical protein